MTVLNSSLLYKVTSLLFSHSYRVPLLPRQAPMMEPEEKEKGKKKGASMDPLPPMEDLTGLNLDDQLIVHVYNLATHAVFTLVRENVCSW